MIFNPGSLWHTVVPYGKNRPEMKSPQFVCCDFTIFFLKVIFSIFRFRQLLAFCFQNLSNCCRHIYYQSIWRIFTIHFLAGFSVSGNCSPFAFKTSQTVAGTPMISQFDEFFAIYFLAGFCPDWVCGSRRKKKEKESQAYHELSQLFLVELGDGPKHAFPGPGPELCIRHGLLCHTNDLGIFPDVGNERVLKIKKFLNPFCFSCTLGLLPCLPQS